MRSRVAAVCTSPKEQKSQFGVAPYQQFRDGCIRGRGIWNQGELWVYDSTIAGNDSNRAGAIRNEGQMNLRNTTISGNMAHSSDAGTGESGKNGFAVLNNVTITKNTGVGNNPVNNLGGGIQTSEGNITVLKNSIIAGNDGGTGPDDCAGPLSGDSKYNLIGNPTGCVITSYLDTYASYNGTPNCLTQWTMFSEMTAVACLDPLDAHLGSLAQNGGPTATYLPCQTVPLWRRVTVFRPPLPMLAKRTISAACRDLREAVNAIWGQSR